MSLVLRKKCQEVLDNFDLGNFHSSINTYSKLSIVSECGKPFMTIQGIRFSRQIPPIAEMDYAVELLEEFMGVHAGDIKAYLKAKHIFENKKKPIDTAKYDNDVISITFSDNHHQSNIKCQSELTYKDKICMITIFSNDKNFTINTKSNLSKQDINKYKFNEVTFKKYTKILKEFHTYYAEKLAVEKAKQHLSVCDI